MKKHTHFVYCICYIEFKYFKNINRDLEIRGYDKVKAIIPTVSILKKTVKNKSVYEEVPILFNYGFIKMPAEKAFSREYLNKVKKDIPGIRGWVKSVETLHPRKKKLRIDNMDIFDDFSIVAVATRKEVRYFRRLSKQNKRFSLEDLSLKIGDYLVLRGYPFDGVDATIMDINYIKGTVKLLLYPENGKMEINLPFDNVIYSVYQNYDPDKLMVDSKDYEVVNLTEEIAEKAIETRQY